MQNPIFDRRALFMALISTLSLRRFTATAFVPVTRSFTQDSTNKIIDSGALRRQRPARSGDNSIKFVEKLQKERGLYPEFRYGTFLSSTATSAASDEPKIAELPAVFPLAGKDPAKVPPRMRFAPSPTGSLHVGGARTALYNWLVAKRGQLEDPGAAKSGAAAFVVRVEDTDVARSTKESETSVLNDLKWLGLTWDEGPDMPGEFGPYRQSERSDIYFAAAQRLVQEGKAYRCFCTAEELEEMKQQQEANGEIGRYDGRWRDADPAEVNKMLDQKKPYTIRFRVPENSRVVIDDVVRGTVSWDAAATVGDFILLRSTGVPVYNFCVAVDDASMGISTVVRAEEHLTNTVRQGLVLDALGAPRPRYAHCSLILGEDKQKLSKRHGATSCDQYRLDGFLPDAMINYLALLGWGDGADNEIFTRDELIDSFDLNRVVKSPSVFDVNKLKWVNSQHMKRMEVETLVPFVKDQMEMEGIFKDGADAEKTLRFTIASTALAKQMMETTKDAVTNAKMVLHYHLPASFDELEEKDARKMIQKGHFYGLAQTILQQVEDKVFPMPDNDPMSAFRDEAGSLIIEDSQAGSVCQYTQTYKAHMKTLAKEFKLKGKDLFHPIRLMLTGEMSGQDVTKQLSMLAMADPEYIAAEIVPFEDRMTKLRAFLETIPEEYRASVVEDKDSKKQAEAATEKAAASVASASSTVEDDPKETYDGPPITALDIRVGQITKVWEHEEADKLYCEEIDVGEDEPRQVASGLRPYLKASDLEGRKVLVLCNLKTRKMVGFPSHGMVLCASNADHSVVKLVSPPIDAKIGERVTVPDFPDFADDVAGAPYAENKIGKKKVFEKIAPHLKTSKYGVPEFLNRPLMTSAGVCTSPIVDGTVS